ncbi:venom metalloproteinase antarease-like TpachMP_B isoform X2 [Amblyomma americanum]
MGRFCRQGNVSMFIMCAHLITSQANPQKGTIETGVIVSSALASSFAEFQGHEHKYLLDYLRLLFSAVNKIMASTDRDNLDMQVVVTDIVILDNDTEIAYQRFDNKTMAGSITEISKFIERNHHIFDGDDVVLYMSKFDIAKQQFGSGFETLRGMSYIGGACSKDRVALISNEEEPGAVATTTAHEMLHLVGAAHDGAKATSHLHGSPGALECSDDPQFILSTWTNQTMLSWSECTKNQVSTFLKSEKGQCLLNLESRSYPPISEAIIRTIVQDPHKYCNMLHAQDRDVQFVAKYNEEYNIKSCVLVCSTTSTDGGRDYHIHRAPDYVYCGISSKNKTMVCINQFCVDRLWRPKFISPLPQAA